MPFTRDASVPAQGYMLPYSLAAAMKGMGPTTARRPPEKDRARRGGLPGALGARDWGDVPFTRDASVPAQGYMLPYSLAAAMKGMGPTTARRPPEKDRARRGGLPGALGARDWGDVPFTRDASVPAQGYMASYSPAAARDGRARPARSAGRKKWSGLARDVTLNGAPLRPVKRHIPEGRAGREKRRGA